MAANAHSQIGKANQRSQYAYEHAYLEVFDNEDETVFSTYSAEYEEPRNRRAARKSEQAQLTRRRRHYDFY